MLYLELFQQERLENTPTSGIVTPRDLNYLKRLYSFNRDSIKDYYSSRNFAVKNTHILSRILEHFPTFMDYDSYRYLEFSNERTKYLAKHFKFTSAIEKGLVHPSYFYGNSGEEIILSTYDNFDINKTEKEWRTISPISIVTHNVNDLKMLLPLGNDNGSRSGLDIISVNIPMLSIKYREFIKEQFIHEKTGEGLILNKNYFVSKYVLPTMIEDSTDHAFLNKVMDKFYGREVVTPNFKHRFKIFEPNVQVERYIDDTLDIITSKNIDFVNILKNIQLMFKQDASELLSLKDAAETRQIKWATYVGKLDYMIFLYDVSINKDRNKHYLNDFKNLTKRMKKDNSFTDLFSYSSMSVINEKMYKISQM